MQLQRAQRLGHVRQGDTQVMAEMLLRLSHSLMLSPNGVINPTNEQGMREFAETFLRPMLMP